MSEDGNPGGASSGMVEVELLGVARHLARRESVEVALDEPARLDAFLHRLADELPVLVGTVLDEQGGFLGGHALSRGGIDLLRNPEDRVHPGDRLMLLSLSAGG